MAYGDAFGSQPGSGAGQDNTYWPSSSAGDCNNTPPSNAQAGSGGELERYSCSQVSVDGNGLHLNCAYSGNTGVAWEPYSCGAIVTGGDAPAGYRLFNVQPGHGQYWAFQIVAKFPLNSGEADNNFWMYSAHPSSSAYELDMFEAYGSGAGRGGSWCQATSGNGWIGITDPSQTTPQAAAGDESLCKHAQPTPFDPSQAYHTYTTYLFPTSGGTMMSEYIDGYMQKWDYVPNTGSSPTPSGCIAGSCTTIGPISPAPNMAGLITEYAMRNVNYLGCGTGADCPFTSGTRSFDVRSIAVYENATANLANTANGGLAPGTTVAP